MNALKKFWNGLVTRLIGGSVRELVEWMLVHEHRLVGPPDRLKIAPEVEVNNAFFNTVSGNIIVEAGAFFGHSVSVLTGYHDPDATGDQRWHWQDSGRDIIVKRGAWIASNVTILGPCIIGEDSVVAAGALVNKDVPARTIVAGVPAKVIRQIPETTGQPPKK